MERILFLYLMFLASCSPSGQTDLKEDSNGQIWTEKDRTLAVTELDRTTDELLSEIWSLDDDQWFYTYDQERWSIAQIIEHLTVQNELHFREIRAISKTPPADIYHDLTLDNDQYYLNYATDPKAGKAQWFLEPIGRFCTKSDAIEAFTRARGHLTDFVRETDIDLRRHFTFRRQLYTIEKGDILKGDVRDLHQLILTGIAHTDRHLSQIRNVKKGATFPR